MRSTLHRRHMPEASKSPVPAKEVVLGAEQLRQGLRHFARRDPVVVGRQNKNGNLPRCLEIGDMEVAPSPGTQLVVDAWAQWHQ